MKKNTGKTGSLVFFVLLACLALAVLAGCDGIAMPSAQPSATEALAPTETPAPSASPVESSAAAVTPSPSPTDTPSASPADSATAPEVSPSPTAEPTATASLADTASPTATPEVTPTPTPEPNHDGDSPGIIVVKYYGRTCPGSLPADLGMKLKYTKYWSDVAPMNFLDYFEFPRNAIVRALPNSASKSLQTVHATNRLPLLAEVKGTDGKSVWFRVRTTGGAIGYVPSAAGWPDSFEVEQAFEQVKKMQAVADQPNTSRISNYNNIHGLPPAEPTGSKTMDSWTNLRDQGAPAYLTPSTASSFRYAPDGMLGQTLGVKGTFTEMYFPAWSEVRYVPSKYVTKGDFIQTMTQAIVVNRNLKRQNIITFELIDGKWTIVSMCFVSTGANKGPYKPTPLGDFFTQKHHGKNGIGEFYYFGDGSTTDVDANGKQKFEGYAPWAIRFTAGAYLHGMPISSHYDATGHLIPSKRTAEVYGGFIGVYPASHMCVRNYTSHAYFMYNWIRDGQAAVIVIQ